MTVSEKIRSIGILPVINIKKEEWAEPLANTLIRSGIPAIEIVLRNEKALSILEGMKKNHPDMTVGAGTVLSVEQAEAAVAAGADFLVSPGYSQAIVDFCNERGVLYVPGCTSASDIQAAYSSGLRTVKFFPAEQLGGIKTIKQLAAPFAGMRFIPTNGMTLDNIASYLCEDCIAACGGSYMAPAAALEAEDFEKIESLCKKAVLNSLGFSLAHVGVNCEGDDDALRTAQAFCSAFLLPVIGKGKSVFAGAAVECMKHNGRGEKGHIGFRTLSVDRAVAYLQKQSFEFLPETAGYDANGSLKYIYLKDEIAGFALHLVK